MPIPAKTMLVERQILQAAVGTPAMDITPITQGTKLVETVRVTTAPVTIRQPVCTMFVLKTMDLTATHTAV